jgi:DNA polymerase III subunit gamma/tau
MRNAPNHRLLLEVALIRSAAPDTDPSAMGLLGRIERLERRIGIDPPQRQAPGEDGVDAERRPADATPAPAAAAKRSERPRSDTPVAVRGPEAAPPTGTDVERAPAPKGDEAAAEPAVAAAEVGFTHFKDAWPTVIKEVNKRSKRVGAFLNPSRPVRFEGQTLVVEVQSDFHAQAMSEKANKELLATAVHSALGAGPPLSFVEKDKAPPVAAVEESVEDLPPEGEAVEEADPVELVRKDLGAEVVEERKP